MRLLRCAGHRKSVWPSPRRPNVQALASAQLLARREEVQLVMVVVEIAQTTASRRCSGARTPGNLSAGGFVWRAAQDLRRVRFTARPFLTGDVLDRPMPAGAVPGEANNHQLNAPCIRPSRSPRPHGQASL